MSSESYKSQFIQLLHKILPEDYLVASPNSKLKENFWIDLMESKDEYIISMATVGIFPESYEVLVWFINDYEENIDFLHYLKLQIDFHILLYSLYHRIPNFDDAAISPYVRKMASKTLIQEDVDKIKHLIEIYKSFIENYNYITTLDVSLDRQSSDNIFYILQNFKNSPESISEESYRNIERTNELVKRLKIQYKNK